MTESSIGSSVNGSYKYCKKCGDVIPQRDHNGIWRCRFCDLKRIKCGWAKCVCGFEDMSYPISKFDDPCPKCGKKLE